MGGSCGLWRKARGGSCGLWRKARRGNFICVRGSKVGRGAFSLLGPFYVPGCVVPLLVCVCDASFELLANRLLGKVPEYLKVESYDVSVSKSDKILT